MSDIRYFPVSPIGEIYGKITNNSIIGTLAAVDGANDEKPNPNYWTIKEINVYWDDKHHCYTVETFFDEIGTSLNEFVFSFKKNNLNGECSCAGNCEIHNSLLVLEGLNWIIPKEQDNETYRGNVFINGREETVSFTVVDSEPIKEAGENEVKLDGNDLQIIFQEPLDYESKHNIYYHCKYQSDEVITGYIDGFQGSNEKLYIPTDGYSQGIIDITIYFPDVDNSIMDNSDIWGNCRKLKELYESGFYPYSKVVTTYVPQ